MKGHFYLCAYGNQTRWSKKCTSENEARKYTFGVTDRVTVIDAGTRTPQYMTLKAKNAIKAELAKKHFAATGEKI
jgi:hypothetical protein